MSMHVGPCTECCHSQRVSGDADDVCEAAEFSAAHLLQSAQHEGLHPGHHPRQSQPGCPTGPAESANRAVSRDTEW